MALVVVAVVGRMEAQGRCQRKAITRMKRERWSPVKDPNGRHSQIHTGRAIFTHYLCAPTSAL